MIGNCLSFVVGSGLLSAHEEDAPNSEGSKEVVDDQDPNHNENVSQSRTPVGTDSEATEETSLLPSVINRQQQAIQRSGAHGTGLIRQRLPHYVRKSFDIAWQFFNGPFIGMAVGLVIGLTPALQRLCFADLNEGGYLQAWLMKSIQQMGSLFSALQTLTVGAKLSKAALAVKAHRSEEEAGHVPWSSFFFVEGVRNMVWPAISIPTIWAVATKTTWFADDPVPWFCMMQAPVGPPALKLLAAADISGARERDKMAIAKFLTVSTYTLT